MLSWLKSCASSWTVSVAFNLALSLAFYMNDFCRCKHYLLPRRLLIKCKQPFKITLEVGILFHSKQAEKATLVLWWWWHKNVILAIRLICVLHQINMLKQFTVRDVKKLVVFITVVLTSAFFSFCALEFSLKDITYCLPLKGMGFPCVLSKCFIGWKLVLTTEHQF